MKKSLLALAALGTLAGTASAQTALTVYGIVDAGIVSERGGPQGSVLKLSSGVQNGTRLGFRGIEDLGGGLSARFVLETGIAADTGGFNQGNLAFARQAFVGFSGTNWGSVTLGRQYTPHYLAIADIDPFAVGLAGNALNLMSTVIRMSNTIKYSSANWGGFNGEAAYGFGEVAGDNTANRQIGASVGYTNGPIIAKLAYHTAYDLAGINAFRTILLGAKYDFGPAAASLAYGANRGVATIDSRDWMVGVSVPFGASTLLASYVRKDDRTIANQDAHQWALGYTYAVSKRTNFYTSYGNISNDNGARFTVGNAIDPGTGDKAFNVGVRHSF